MKRAHALRDGSVPGRLDALGGRRRRAARQSHTSCVLRLMSSVCFAAAAASALSAASRACIAFICASSSLDPCFTVKMGVLGFGRRIVGFFTSSGSVTSKGDLFDIVLLEDVTETVRTGIFAPTTVSDERRMRNASLRSFGVLTGCKKGAVPAEPSVCER